MQGRENNMPGQSSKPKLTVEKKKREKKVAEATAKAEAIGAELDREVKSLDSESDKYGSTRFSSGGLNKYVFDERSLELILSDDRAASVKGAKEAVGKKIQDIEAGLTKANTDIKTKENSLRVKGLTDGDKVKIKNEIEAMEAARDQIDKALSAEREWQTFINDLEAMLSKDSAKENWKKIDANKSGLKSRLTKITSLRAAKEKAEIERDTVKSVASLVTLLDELIVPFKGVVQDPFKFMMTTTISKNLQGKDIETMHWISKAKLGFDIAGDIIDDPSIKLTDLGVKAVGAVTKNLGEVINLAADVPNLINNELKAKGQDITDPNNFIQSNFMGSLLKDPLIYELLLNHAEDMGQILWNFQNDLVWAIKKAIETPSDITTLSKLKMGEGLLDSPSQLQAIVTVVALNIPQFQKMFSDERSAFNKVMKEYGVEKPELIADLIPSIVSIGTILPAHHGSIKSIFAEISQILLSGKDIDLDTLLAPSKDPNVSKLNAIIGEASKLLFGSADVNMGIVDRLHSMLSKNAAQLAELAMSVAPIKAIGLGKDVIQNVIVVAAEIMKPENHEAFKEILALVRELKFDEKGAPIIGVAEILNVANTAMPLLQDPQFGHAVVEFFKEGMAKQVRPAAIGLLGGIFGERIPAGFVNSINDDTFKLAGNLVSGVLENIPTVIEVINTYQPQLEKIEQLVAIQAQLENPKLTIEERQSKLAEARGAQLEANDIKELMFMGLEVIEASRVSGILLNNQQQLIGLARGVQDVIKPLLPVPLRNSDNLIPDMVGFAVSAVSTITDEKSRRALRTIPNEVETILKQLGEDKPAFAQIYEAASNIGESVSQLINNKEFINLYEQQFIPMLQKPDTRAALNAFVDGVLKASPDARKFHIKSEDVLKLLENKEVLGKFSSAFNDLLQKDFASRVRGVVRAAGLAVSSKDARTLVWQLVIDGVVSYFRENIVPDFIKRWMAAADMEATLLLVDKDKDLAKACTEGYQKLPFGLSRYLIKTHNFSGQYITGSIAGMVIDNFNFKDASFAGGALIEGKDIDLRGATISNSNMKFVLGYEQKVDLTGATIDIKTLESMVDVINSGKAITAEIKLSEAPVTKEAQRVLELIKDPEIRNRLETNYAIKAQVTFAEKEVAAKGDKEAVVQQR